MRFWLVAFCATLVATLSALSGHRREAFARTLSQKRIYNNNSLSVDLGYEKYQGGADSSTGLKTWKGYVCLSNKDQS